MGLYFHTWIFIQKRTLIKKKETKKKKINSWASMAHTCNPSNSGSRDQEDLSSKPLGKQFARPYLKKAYHKIGLVEWLKV
jgi:hypothetical protein